MRANGSRERAPDDRLREAIHLAAKKVWIASSLALLAMTLIGSRIRLRPRDAKRPSCAFISRPKRAWGTPGARCTRGLVCTFVVVERTRVTTSTPQHPAFPHAMVLTVSFVLSVTGLVCHRRLRTCVASAPGRADTTSATLTPASGRQDHTTSPYAAAPFVSPPVDRSQIFRPALHHLARLTLLRPPHPSPTFVTIAKRPSCGLGCKKF